MGETGRFLSGLSGTNFIDNFGPDFTATWGFGSLIALFFPSVTGIEAGSNRSGDLADAQASIPKGTLGAWTVTTVTYLGNTIIWGCVAARATLKDESGVSKIAASMCWPLPELVAAGITFSSVGAGLQSLVGAPRVLQAIAKDNLLPFLRPFAGTPSP